MYKYIFSFIFVPLVCLAIAMPAQANHGNGNGNHNNNGKAHLNQINRYNQSNLAYQYNTSSVELTRLYALIAQLQAQLAALQGYNPVYPPYHNGGYQSSNDITRVTTGSVDGDGDDSVSMEGSVTFRRDSEARVWFEYGTNNKMSYSTRSIEIDGDGGDTEDFEITATDLDDDTYYYRAVAEDDNGRYVEGVVRSFRFDGRNDDDDDDDDDDNDGDWSLEVDDDYYETGDSIRVEYEVEDEDDDNYIALFEAGDDDDDYIRRVFVDDEEGYVTFRIYEEGEYEFRLFDEDEDVQAESDEIEVED